MKRQHTSRIVLSVILFNIMLALPVNAKSLRKPTDAEFRYCTIHANSVAGMAYLKFEFDRTLSELQKQINENTGLHIAEKTARSRALVDIFFGKNFPDEDFETPVIGAMTLSSVTYHMCIFRLIPLLDELGL